MTTNPETRRVIIPKPKHRHGATVQALNYRKRPGEWERGTVTSVSISNAFGHGFHVSYTVRLERTTVGWRHARVIDLHVGADGIRCAEKET